MSAAGLRRDASDYRFTPFMRVVGFIMLGSNVAILPVLLYLGAQFLMPQLPINLAAHWILPGLITICIVCNILLRIPSWHQKKLPPDAQATAVNGA